MMKIVKKNCINYVFGRGDFGVRQVGYVTANQFFFMDGPIEVLTAFTVFETCSYIIMIYWC